MPYGTIIPTALWKEPIIKSKILNATLTVIATFDIFGYAYYSFSSSKTKKEVIVIDDNYFHIETTNNS